ncbi:MAG: ferredoxin family protein [Thermoclostridium sp.]|nr:ferredoxin family protein [Thermoclostridium sp.]
MSIAIDKELCRGCGACIEICPGKLIYKSEEGWSYMKYPRDCWGCASCVKECAAGAIRYYLGADIGGKGAWLTTEDREGAIDFIIVNGDKQQVITVNRKESNKY